MNAIIMLHSVDHSGGVISITPDELESLINSIRSEGNEIVPLLDLLERPQADGRVALTFDDGFQNVFDTAARVLSLSESPATLFLTTAHVGGDTGWASLPAGAARSAMMTWDQVGALAESGWSIEAHTLHHPDLRTLDDVELERELSEPPDEIERYCGRRPSILAYPYGYFDDRVVDRARNHYRFAVTTSHSALPRRHVDPMRVPRLDAYYLRAPMIHRRFGHPDFRVYAYFRRALRRLRGHPGEIS